jgi:hypothetical protein
MSSGPTPFKARFVTATQQLLALARRVRGADAGHRGGQPRRGGGGPGQRRGPPGSLMSAYGEEALRPRRSRADRSRRKLREVPADQPRRRGKGCGRTARRHAERPRRDGPDGGSRLTSLPQKVTGYGSVGVTWAPRRPAVRDRPQLRGPHPHRRHLVRLDDARVPRRPRTGSRERRGPARAPGHGAAAGRRRRRRAGTRGRRGGAARGHAAGRHRSGNPEGHGDRASRHRHQHDGRQRRLALGVRRDGSRRRGAGSSRW